METGVKDSCRQAEAGVLFLLVLFWDGEMEMGDANGDVQARFILQIEITRNKKRGNVGR